MIDRRLFVVGAAASLAAPAIRAQSLPTQPVRILVGFAPGGGTDLLARVVGQKLADMWKTQVIVENRAGASGAIASDLVARQPGDGTVLHMAHINS
ncbi:MAG: putative extracytoplasmic binding receptor, partial [Pseudomonadota bacterium]